MDDFRIAIGFDGDTLPPVPYTEALHRVQAFCTARGSGWLTYDLAAIQARASGAFDIVAVWSLLWADALAGQLAVRDLAGFNMERRSEFARRISAIPDRTGLGELDADGRSAVAHLCRYGWPGVWGPKITKVGALYRPASVPVLDGYVALAFGFKRDGFSEGKEPRWSRIERVIDALAQASNANADLLRQLRADARELVPDLKQIPDLRLLDIIIWTSQDDRMSRARKAANQWVNAGLRERTPITLEEVTPVRVGHGDRRA